MTAPFLSGFARIQYHKRYKQAIKTDASYYYGLNSNKPKAARNNTPLSAYKIHALLSQTGLPRQSITIEPDPVFIDSVPMLPSPMVQ